jgi:hypothetical protein
MIQKFEQFVNESNMARLTELEQEAIEILGEVDGYYNVTDFELTAQRSLITHIAVDDDNVIHYFAGDIEDDKHAEEILPTDDEKIRLLSEFVKLA